MGGLIRLLSLAGPGVPPYRHRTFPQNLLCRGGDRHEHRLTSRQRRSRPRRVRGRVRQAGRLQPPEEGRLQRPRRPEPTLSLEGDAEATGRIIDAQDGPVVLVGHSYGGAVITEGGNDVNVAALVYIAAFAPDNGESVNTLIADPPPGAPVPPILPPKDGFLFLDRMPRSRRKAEAGGGRENEADVGTQARAGSAASTCQG